MSKVKYIIEVDKDDIDVFLNQMNAHYIITQYNGEIAVCGRVLLSTFKTATPITECDDCVSRQAVLSKAFEIKTGKNTSAMVVYAEDIRKELPVKPKLAFNERITTIPMPFE